MVQAQVSGKSSSPRVLGVGSWWEALQNRYVITLPSGLILTEMFKVLTRTVEHLGVDVAAASRVDRGRGHPAALCLRSGPLWRFCI